MPMVACFGKNSLGLVIRPGKISNITFRCVSASLFEMAEQTVGVRVFSRITIKFGCMERPVRKNLKILKGTKLYSFLGEFLRVKASRIISQEFVLTEWLLSEWTFNRIKQV